MRYTIIIDVYVLILYLSNSFYNKIEKKKAIESKEYPHPYYIRRCLGDALGDVVVGLIPKDILERLKSESNGGVAPDKFEMKPENFLANDLKLTPVDEFPDSTSYMETILRKSRESIETKSMLCTRINQCPISAVW